MSMICEISHSFSVPFFACIRLARLWWQFSQSYNWDLYENRIQRVNSEVKKRGKTLIKAQIFHSQIFIHFLARSSDFHPTLSHSCFFKKVLSSKRTRAHVQWAEAPHTLSCRFSNFLSIFPLPAAPRTSSVSVFLCHSKQKFLRRVSTFFAACEKRGKIGKKRKLTEEKKSR